VAEFVAMLNAYVERRYGAAEPLGVAADSKG
jgi:hypothetical protein